MRAQCCAYGWASRPDTCKWIFSKARGMTQFRMSAAAVCQREFVANNIGNGGRREWPARVAPHSGGCAYASPARPPARSDLLHLLNRREIR